jgi:hypothetical protein
MVKSVSLVLFPLACLYVLYGLGDTLYGKVTGREPSNIAREDMEAPENDDVTEVGLQAEGEENEISSGDSLASF